MMEMMFAINKDNFEGHLAVTCNSCHNGTALPQAIPAVVIEEPKEPIPMTGPKPPEAKENHGPTLTHVRCFKSELAPDSLYSTEIDVLAVRTISGSSDILDDCHAKYQTWSWCRVFE